MNAPKKRLGRGLEALLGGGSRQGQAVAEAVDAPEAAGLQAREMPIATLKPGRYQPRQTLAEEGLKELADSIREQGVLQPLVVRPIPVIPGETQTHEIVAGERRWRASELVGLETVPVIVRELDDQSALAVALIENLQREDLNPIEQAQSLTRLATEFELTHQQVADAVGRSRSAVSNLLRLLDLNDDVKTMLAERRLEMGHARALLSLADDEQLKVARRAAAAGWSVRQVEKSVRKRQEAARQEPEEKEVDLQTHWLQEQLANALGGQVALKNRGDDLYRLDIEFGDLDELQGSLQTVLKLITQLREAAGPRVRDRKS